MCARVPPTKDQLTVGTIEDFWERGMFTDFGCAIKKTIKNTCPPRYTASGVDKTTEAVSDTAGMVSVKYVEAGTCDSTLPT
jgi:hypothetical protein